MIRLKVVRWKNFLSTGNQFLEVKLDKKEMNFLWDRVKEARGSEKQRLAGNITASLKLIDKDNTKFNKGDFVSYKPGSHHSSHTKKGCTLLVFMRKKNKLL